MRFRVVLLASLFVASCVLCLIFLYVINDTSSRLQHSTHVQSEVQSSRSPLHIAVVVCGQRLQETLVMIKSALLFNYRRDFLLFLVFAEDGLIPSLREKFSDWRLLLPQQFDFKLLPLQFPLQSETEWRSLFKPCAAQRLFLPVRKLVYDPSILKTIDAILYVDADILFLSPVSDIWHFFSSFNITQIAALAPEHEDESIGWYNRFARHPYYGNLGINSGVMLMNLTRMRDFGWETRVLPIHKEYKLRITFGDQDILNILFYYYPEKLYVMPCEYNYRPDHCMYMSVCNASVEGIKVLHGNRGYFHSNKQPLFRVLYDTVEKYQLGTNAYRNFLLPLQNALEESTITESNCGKLSKDALQIANKIFPIDYNYDS